MLRFLNRQSLAIVLLAFALGACDDEPELPTTPTPDPKTETFIGTVSQSGGDTHDFSVAAGGRVTAVLKTIGADNTLVVGFLLGNWNSVAGSCSVVLAKDDATAGSVLTGTMTSAGPLCVRVYDVGNITGTPAPYSVEVTHP
jgi:hypothetical protein